MKLLPKRIKTILALLLIVLLYACSSNINLENERRKLIQADKEWSEAAKNDDMEKLWSFWAEDAKILLSNGRTISGIDEIKQFTTQARNDPNFEIYWELEGADVSASGDMGYTYGTGTLTRTGENGDPFALKSPYLVVWKKQPDGSWKGIVEK